MIRTSSFVVIGLGNPGKEYEKTRHNAGRLALEYFRKKHGFPEWEKDSMRTALVSKGEVGGVSVELLLPETFMNNSGASIKHLMAGGLTLAANLIVVHDDVDIPLGSLKIVFDRGSAGHNGVNSIIQTLGTKKFSRIRIGVAPVDGEGKTKKPKGEEATAKFVLKKFTATEQKKMDEVFEKTSGALLAILKEGKEKAMNQFNQNLENSK